MDKYGLTMDDLEQIRGIIKRTAEENNLEYTIGTDSHTLDGYDAALKWLKDNEAIILEKLATWIRN